MLNFVAWIVGGGLLGFAASRAFAGEAAPTALLNILAGAVGGFVSGLLVKSVLAALQQPAPHLSVLALGAALSGAALLLVVVNVPRRARE